MCPSSDRYIGEPEYPAPWTTDRPFEGLRDDADARIVSLAPDVCLTPVGNAMVPIPYPIASTAGDDADFTTTVRFTGQRAMVLRSHTTRVTGDEAGTGRGVISGTVGGICEPIGHAALVRAEGSPVIRHLDRFWMNNRNTVGEAIFVRDTATYPAPEDDDPVTGSLSKPRLAEVEPARTLQDGDPARGAPSKPGAWAMELARMPAEDLPGGIQGDESFSPDRPWRHPPPGDPEPESGLSRLGRFGQWLGRTGGGVLSALTVLLYSPTVDDGMPPAWFDGLFSDDPVIRRLAEEAQRRYEENRDLQPELEEWYDAERRFHLGRIDLPAEEAEPEPEPEPGGRPPVFPLPPQPPDTGTRVTQRPRRRCRVLPYGQLRGTCPPGMQAHHIVPDFTLRYGRRHESDRRIRNMPSLDQGAAICLRGHAGMSNTEHHEAHVVDSELERQGALNTPPDTLRLETVIDESVAAVIALRDECEPEIRTGVDLAFEGVDSDQLVRSKRSELPTGATLEALISGQRQRRRGDF